MNTKHLFFILLLLASCQQKQPTTSVITTDITTFWSTFDIVSKQTDTLKQLQTIQEQFINNGTPGLKAMMTAKRYTPQDYVDAINNYPKFWKSVRPNTLKANQFSDRLEAGIQKLRDIYPALKPAKIYFTVGAMRSGGTTLDSLVLIGSELAMVDPQTDHSEFEGRLKGWATTYFASDPISNLVLLNVHEYVHTQQKPIPATLLQRCLYEGVAEFVSVKAMGVPSSSPAIEFGKNNPKVKAVFEQEMFYERTRDWLWSNSPNQFEVRDLGYYIGYEMSEGYYNNATNKRQAIKDLIELDYTNEKQVNVFIDQLNFFSKPLATLQKEYDAIRPTVVDIHPLKNYSTTVNPNTKQITLNFSQPMNQNSRNFDFGPLGEKATIKFKKQIGYSKDSKSYTFEIQDLEPNKKYQLLIGSGFKNQQGAALKPYLIEFKTAN